MKDSPIVIASDHAAFSLKAEIVSFLQREGRPVEDLGHSSSDRVDYPDFARRVALKVVGSTATRGILLCGSGIGMSIAANKIDGIRAALCHDVTTAKLSRQHNDANVLCLGGRTTGLAVALDIVTAWLATPFEGGRHQQRIDKVHALEREPSMPGTAE